MANFQNALVSCLPSGSPEADSCTCHLQWRLPHEKLAGGVGEAAPASPKEVSGRSLWKQSPEELGGEHTVPERVLLQGGLGAALTVSATLRLGHLVLKQLEGRSGYILHLQYREAQIKRSCTQGHTLDVNNKTGRTHQAVLCPAGSSLSTT